MVPDSHLDIARIFANVAGDLASQPDAESVGQRVASVASTVLGCPWTQVVHLTERGTLSYREPTDPVLRTMLRISAEQREGIVSETVTGETTIVVDDMTHDRRWPHYSARVLAETPVRSAASFVLKLGSTCLGALAVFAPEPHHFDSKDVNVGGVLADHASVALAHATSASRAHNLEIALMTNRKIGMAIGVLMARQGITDEQAFDLLRTTSQHSHCKLRDVAEYVTMTGELPASESAGRVPHANPSLDGRLSA